MLKNIFESKVLISKWLNHIYHSYDKISFNKEPTAKYQKNKNSQFYENFKVGHVPLDVMINHDRRLGNWSSFHKLFWDRIKTITDRQNRVNVRV